MEYYLAIKNNEIMPFAGTCMGPEIVILDEVSKRNTVWYCLHVQSKKNGTNELIYKTEIQSQM